MLIHHLAQQALTITTIQEEKVVRKTGALAVSNKETQLLQAVHLMVNTPITETARSQETPHHHIIILHNPPKEAEVKYTATSMVTLPLNLTYPISQHYLVDWVLDLVQVRSQTMLKVTVMANLYLERPLQDIQNLSFNTAEKKWLPW
jgi:hypothetical protein